MKKIKLDTNVLRLKKEEISNLTSDEMKQIVGGNTPVITDQCITNGCGTTQYQCTTSYASTHQNCGTDTYDYTQGTRLCATSAGCYTQYC